MVPAPETERGKRAMSDHPFELPETPPVMSADQARDVARKYKGFAEHLAAVGVMGDARRMERQSAWWLAYAIALAQPHS